MTGLRVVATPALRERLRIGMGTQSLGQVRLPNPLGYVACFARSEPPRGGRGLGQQSVRGEAGMSQDEIEARKKRAERGWLADPPPPPPRAYIPGEENTWYLMMGARHVLERRREREQQREGR